MTILYEVNKNLYINLTNKCPCNCTFCIRNNGDGAYGSDSLWLERDPFAREVIEQLKSRDLDSYDEIVFCGFGEPFEALGVMLDVAGYLKSVTSTTIRVNTNGLSDLINQKPTAHLLNGLIDIVSVSLNAGTKAEYLKVTRPSFGDSSYDAMLKFAVDCKKYVKSVVLSIVDVIPADEIEKCRQISNKLDIPLRIRKYDE